MKEEEEEDDSPGHLHCMKTLRSTCRLRSKDSIGAIWATSGHSTACRQWISAGLAKSRLLHGLSILNPTTGRQFLPSHVLTQCHLQTKTDTITTAIQSKSVVVFSPSAFPHIEYSLRIYSQSNSRQGHCLSQPTHFHTMAEHEPALIKHNEHLILVRRTSMLFSFPRPIPPKLTLYFLTGSTSPPSS